MAMDIVFWILAILGVGAALAVVLLRNIFRAALALVLCFLAVAGFYIILNADFLAAVQVLIYVGGIGILIVLAIMLTRDVQQGSPSNRLRVPALIGAVLVFAVMSFAMVNTPWQIVPLPVPEVPTTPVLAERLLGEGGFILTVGITATMLLAVVLGAVALMREK